MPGYEATQWYGFLAPAGTPAAIIEQIHAEAMKALNSTEMREKLAHDGAEPAPSTPEAFAAHIKDEIDKWRQGGEGRRASSRSAPCVSKAHRPQPSAFSRDQLLDPLELIRRRARDLVDQLADLGAADRAHVDVELCSLREIGGILVRRLERCLQCLGAVRRHVGRRRIGPRQRIGNFQDLDQVAILGILAQARAQSARPGIPEGAWRVPSRS